MLEVTKAKHVSGYTMWLSFNDGTEGQVDLKDSLWGPMFEPLRNVDAFRQVSISPILHTIAWPNEADFAPEHLKKKLIEQSNTGKNAHALLA
jgi:hypothetical protein